MVNNKNNVAYIDGANLHKAALQLDKCSILLKRTGAKIAYITDQCSILEAIKEKAPDADGTAQGFFS